MERHKYQLVFLGGYAGYKDTVCRILKHRLWNLKCDNAYLQVLCGCVEAEKVRQNNPVVYLYFAEEHVTSDSLYVDSLIKECGVCILPVVGKDQAFAVLPQSLRGINGFRIVDIEDTGYMVDCILNEFSLLWNTCRVFISYKRSDSSAVAEQLYLELKRAGYDVFIDVCDIPKGRVLRDEIGHSLADADLMLLLDTKDVPASDWVREEIAKVGRLQVAVLQLVWPRCTPATGILSETRQLTDNDFEDGKDLLKDDILRDIMCEIREIRIANLVARRNNLASPFRKAAKELSMKVYWSPHQFFIVDGVKKALCFPVAGVPRAIVYDTLFHRAEHLYPDISEIRLLYDQLYIKREWVSHLNFLDGYLPVRSIEKEEVKSWLSTL